MKAETLLTLEQIIADRLGNWPPQWEGFHWPGYTLEHTHRVRNLARKLAQMSGADLLVVDTAALLHDLAKPEGSEHARLGATEAAQLLRRHGLQVDFVEQVHHAIHTHSGDNTPTHPLENRVLGDADLIDANFGLVATWRFITIRAGRGSTVAETVAGFTDWLPRKDELMPLLRTPAGESVARERSAAMHRFCAEVEAAYAGHGAPVLRAMVEFIFGAYERASLGEQMAALGEMMGGDGVGGPVVRRLAAEIAGEV